MVLAALMTPLVLALSMFVLCMLFSLVRWSLTVDDMTHAILPLCLVTLVLGYAVILPFGLPLLLFINHKLGVVNKRTIGKVAVLSGGLAGCLISFAVWGFPIPAMVACILWKYGRTVGRRCVFVAIKTPTQNPHCPQHPHLIVCLHA